MNGEKKVKSTCFCFSSLLCTFFFSFPLLSCQGVDICFVDKILATKIKCDEKTIKKVKNTWEHVLKKQGDLPNDWIDSPEVLVGSGA